MSELLCSRGIDSKAKYDQFINSEMPINDDPYALSDMDKAVQTIHSAIDEHKSICIYGDYDVDGVCATVILYKVLSALTCNLSYYIPSRHTEGYGMHEDSIRALAREGVKLIITVDNGITAIKEAALAVSLGIDLVITDHHRFPDELPVAKAVVASSRNNYSSKINDLSGAGVAWMLARAISGQPLTEYLPYVSLAIAADSVNVTGFNRGYLKNSFPMFQKEIHFEMLLKKAGAFGTPVSMFTLNYVFAPRINAAGRLAHADIAFRFFLSDDPGEMEKYADQLEGLNQKRKEEESRIFSSCIENNRNISDVLVFYGENWNPGVVGIVASRLVEMYHKNVFVLGKTESGTYVGSGRSDENTDLYALLLPCEDILERFGGHAGAAGITVSENNLFCFIDAVNDSFRKMFPRGAPSQKTAYDIDIETNECSLRLAKEISLLAPFGPGNPEPVFRFSNTRLKSVSLIGKDKDHLSALMCNSQDMSAANQLRLVSFKSGSDYKSWCSSESADILATLTLNSFRGRETCESRCVAFCSGFLFGENDEFIQLVDAFYSEVRYNNSRSVILAQRICELLEFPPLNEERLREMYVLLRNRSINYHSSQKIRSRGTAEELAALLIFKELGLIQFKNCHVLFINTKIKTNCRNSIIFTTLNTK